MFLSMRQLEEVQANQEVPGQPMERLWGLRVNREMHLYVCHVFLLEATEDKTIQGPVIDKLSISPVTGGIKRERAHVHVYVSH